jgi:hypothetical protein
LNSEKRFEADFPQQDLAGNQSLRDPLRIRDCASGAEAANLI